MLVLRGYLDCRFGFVLASVCGGALSALRFWTRVERRRAGRGVRPCAATVICTGDRGLRVDTDVFVAARGVCFFVRAVACACLCVLFVRARWLPARRVRAIRYLRTTSPR